MERDFCERTKKGSFPVIMFEEFKDIHKGERGFIIATGPSLKVSDLDRLVGEVTFSCNKIFLAFDQTDWRPTYYSIIDRLVAQEMSEKVREIRSTKIFSGVTRPFIHDTDILWLRDLPSPVVDGNRVATFSTDLSVGTYGGATVVYTLMQMAYYMGIQTLYLLGLDFKFTASPDTGKKTAAGEVILQQANEVNHFHPNYRQTQSYWTQPRLDEQYKAFICAKQAFEADGRQILNASRQTALDVFERVDYDKL